MDYDNYEYEDDIAVLDNPQTYTEEDYYEENGDDIPDSVYENLVTEDDEPLDSLFQGSQMRLLTESLRTNWIREGGKPYLVAANVGIYYDLKKPPIIPDVFLSLDVKTPKDIHKKKHRCYFVNLYGKPPELAIEIVSNKKGGELTTKLDIYAKMGIKYYAVFDPDNYLGDNKLIVYELLAGVYVRLLGEPFWLDDLQLGLTTLTCKYEETEDDLWLRWLDENGQIIPTGKELVNKVNSRAEKAEKRAEKEKKCAEKEKKRAEKEKKYAEKEKKRAEKEKKRAEKEKKCAEKEKKRADKEKERVKFLEAKLKELGLEI